MRTGLDILLGVSVIALGAFLPSSLALGMGAGIIVVALILDYLRTYHSISKDLQDQYDKAEQDFKNAEADLRLAIRKMAEVETVANQALTKASMTYENYPD